WNEVFFFFQAEDGIRDFHVTGVQTCALPIFHRRSLVIIFSDMFDSGEDTDELFKALQHLKHNKHEVIVFHVLDKATELSFEFQRSEEHTSELQSRENLVCRLLLEKKK